MKLAHYSIEGDNRVGIVKDDRIIDLASLGFSELEGIRSIDDLLLQDKLATVAHLVEQGIFGRSSHPLSSVGLASPILKPSKIYCAAVNYLSHSKEQDVKPPTEPYFFTKFSNAIIGQDDPILLPRVSKKVDWEVELAVVIGRKGKYISKDEAMNYVAGYTISNDISFRDLQRSEGTPPKTNMFGYNWVKGKGLDNALPMGPWLVTADEMGNIYDKRIALSVNDSIRQEARIGDMIFRVDQLIEYLSDGITLGPGDVISTGTPMGVAQYSGTPFLKDGDIVEAEIEGIGKLRNPVENE